MKGDLMILRSEGSMASKVAALALVAAAIGFVMCMIAGVTDTPTIPPGLVAILVAAGLVAFIPEWWAPIAAPAAALFNLVAFVVVGATDRLSDPSPADGLIGTWLMVVALIVAGVAGTIATVQNQRAQGTMTG